MGLLYFDLLNRGWGSVLIVGFAVYMVSIAYAIYRGVTVLERDSDSESENDDDDDDDSDSDSDDNDNAGEDADRRIVSETSPLLSTSINAAAAAAAENGAATSQTSHATPAAARQRRRRRSLAYHITQLLIGLVTLSLSGYILSHSASAIADTLHLSGTVVGITILSFATTLPEKFVAVLSGRRGHGSIMVASTAGSNLFLLTLCLGVTAVTSFGSSRQVGEDHVVIFELAVAWASSALFLLVVLMGLGREAGVLLLVVYVAFLVLEFTVYRR